MEAKSSLVGFHCDEEMLKSESIIKKSTLWTGMSAFIYLKMFILFFWGGFEGANSLLPQCKPSLVRELSNKLHVFYCLWQYLVIK